MTNNLQDRFTISTFNKQMTNQDKINAIVSRIICYFKGHQFIEWEHSWGRPRKEFYPRTAVLINPECARCGIRKFK